MSQTVDIKYTASATSWGGRNGHVKTSDGVLDVKTTEPKELGGAGEQQATNPEQLFAAAYASCFNSAAELAARTLQIKVPDSMEVTCDVSLGKDQEEEGFGLKIAIALKADGLSESEKNRLLKRANELCPYSKATQGNLDVELKVT